MLRLVIALFCLTISQFAHADVLDSGNGAWLLTSTALVLQHPSRKNPVFGFSLQGSRGCPRTFID